MVEKIRWHEDQANWVELSPFSGLSFGVVLLFKAYVFISFRHEYSSLDLVTVYIRAQQIDVWAHMSHIKLFTADYVGVSSFGVQRKFGNWCLGMQPLLRRKSTLDLMCRCLPRKSYFRNFPKYFSTSADSSDSIDREEVF